MNLNPFRKKRPLRLIIEFEQVGGGAVSLQTILETPRGMDEMPLDLAITVAHVKGCLECFTKEHAVKLH